jgi:guanosine-3',5'-bis(diphosphate) 3'-pyrophosphohydrolase
MIYASILINRAEEFARCRHEGQYREGGEPYFNHLNRVAQKVFERGGSPAAVSAAFLHDAVEDEKASLLDIDKLFGNEVYQIVSILTRKAGMTYAQYVDSIAASHDKDAMLIKIADNEDNLLSCGDGTFSPEKEASLKDRWQKCKAKLESVLN